jgi:hypothetical protein
MRINSLLVCAILFGPFTSVHAKVRDVYIAPNEMGVINLRMGQSTVLRFQEKPKKVVIGNQNYFNVEFIDNDVTIQPLGVASTNLFVYGEYNTYGMLLKVNGGGDYDDLAFVKRGFKIASSSTKKEVKRRGKQEYSIKTKIGKDIAVSSGKLIFHNALNLYILDLELSNKSNILEQNGLKVTTTVGAKPYGEVKTIFDENKERNLLKARILIKIPKKKDFTLSIKYQGQEVKEVIKEKFL